MLDHQHDDDKLQESATSTSLSFCLLLRAWPTSSPRWSPINFQFTTLGLQISPPPLLIACHFIITSGGLRSGPPVPQPGKDQGGLDQDRHQGGGGGVQVRLCSSSNALYLDAMISSFATTETGWPPRIQSLPTRRRTSGPCSTTTTTIARQTFPTPGPTRLWGPARSASQE